MKPIQKNEVLNADSAEVRARLRQMILYISQLCDDEPTFGATMLNKILLDADMKAYAHDRSSITGATYIKLQYGSVPKDLLDLKNEMIAAGEIVEIEREYVRYPQKRIIALVDADLSAFTPQQISRVDRTAQRLCSHTAAEVSEATHGRAWRAAALYEAIPYSTVFISNEPVNESDQFYTEVMARKNGWQRVAA